MNLAARIDHTLLKAEATGRDVHRITAEALEHGFASVCVNGAFVKGVTQALSGSPVRTCAVVGFPLGASLASVKAHEAQRAVDDGADEIDVVAFLRNLVQRDLAATKNDLAAVVRAARSKRSDVVVKVIIESAVLLGIDDESVAEQRIETACRAARESGCDFVKTSTGFHPAGGASMRAGSSNRWRACARSPAARSGRRPTPTSSSPCWRSTTASSSN